MDSKKFAIQIVTWLTFFLGIVLTGQPLANWIISKQIASWFIGLIFLGTAGYLTFKYGSLRNEA